MVTNDEIRKIAALAKLSLENEDMDKLASEMNSIIGFADEIASAPVTEVERELAPSNLRKDEVIPSFDRDKILSNAGEADDGYFVARNMGAKGHG